MTYARRRNASLTLAASLLALAFLALAPASASAAQAKLWTTGLTGSEAGETSIPRGIAANPETGHIYVSDQENKRIVEFTAWGIFVRAWGWDVVASGPGEDTSAPEDQFEVCTPANGDVCKEGAKGSQPGQLASPQGMAIDSAGDVYVTESPEGNYRMQKFDLSGSDVSFEWIRGTGVDQGPSHPGDLCTAQYVAEGDTCGKGGEGTGNGQFSGWPFASFIAVGPADQVYVGDKDRIQHFDTDGNYVGQVPLPEPGSVGSLAVDPNSGDLYFAYPPPTFASTPVTQSNVFKLDPTTGKELDELTVQRPSALATDAEGNVYVFDRSHEQSQGPSDQPSRPARLLKFSPGGSLTEVLAQNSAPNVEDEFDRSTGLVANTVTEAGGVDVYLSNANNENSFIRAYGPPPDKWPPPLAAPSIDDQYATSVGANDATVAAQINPHFWSDTAYYVEYGTAPCSEGGCAKQPAPPGSALNGGVVDVDVATAGVFLAGLQPDTTYRYRFVAESSGGGPVIGEGGTEAEEGTEATFTTFPAPEAPNASCPNQAFRTGASAVLPDCRAYEMVSPVDKGGGDVNARSANFGFARLNQSSLTGGRITYSSYRAFADPLAAPFTSQYLAERDPEAGWQSESISSPQEGIEFVGLTQIESLFKDFSPELDYAWLMTNTEPVLGPGGQKGFPNVYRRDNAAKSYGGCTAAPPAEAGKVAPEPQGASEDQAHGLFRSTGDIAEDSAPGNKFELYMCSFPEGGGAPSLALVSVLPDRTASALDSQAGSPAEGPFGQDRGRASLLDGAISADASRVFWTAGEGDRPGTLYLRLNPAQPESARLHGAATGTGDVIGPASGTGTLLSSSFTVSGLVTKSGAFAPGQEVSSPGLLAAGTTVVSCSPSCGAGATSLTLSAKPEKTKVGAELAGVASEVVPNLLTETGAFEAGQEISGAGIPTGTTIVSCAPSCGPSATSLTLSAKVTASKAAAPLSATSPCTEAPRACTLPVSGTVSEEDTRFWGARPDGSLALFEPAKNVSGGGSNIGDLYLYDTAKAIAGEPPSTLVAKESKGVLGFSEDLSRIYFASEEALSEGSTAGEPNLYLYEAGETPSTSFIAPLAEIDTASGASVAEDVPSPVNERPDRHTARVTPDGGTLAFMSSSAVLAQEVAGYDNTDQVSGEPDAEVYRYEAATGELACVSCNRTGARPAGRRLAEESSAAAPLWAVARLRSWENSLTPLHPLSADGRRLFFESFEALVLTDTNGKADVYQWEEAGAGDCDTEDHAYIPASNGCVSLISSGKSPADSEFIDASADGRDAFFTTAASLLSQDPGSVDLYDARAGGGLAPPPVPVPSCEGEACQSPPEAPDDPTPASASFEGAGNVTEGPAKGRKPCAKNKVRRKGRCVAKSRKHAHKRHQRANRNGRAGR